MPGTYETPSEPEDLSRHEEVPTSTTKPKAIPDVPPHDSWELQQQLRDIKRALDVTRAASASANAAHRRIDRFDQAHATPLATHLRPEEKRATIIDREPKKAKSFQPAFAWIALLLGTMSFVCGGILLAWSALTDQPELWSAGVPFAACGQVILLIGLAMQLDHIWNDSRQAAEKLDNVDSQLHDLKTAATRLHGEHESLPAGLYSQLAEDASPESLLNDLKNQLDLLATKISRDSHGK